MPPGLCYPVLLLCGRDQKRRELMRVLDPEGKYPSKCLLPMHGRRVLDWQLDALFGSPSVGKIFLIGLSEADFPHPKELSYIPTSTTTTILEKIQLGSNVILQEYPTIQHLIISTGDVPGMSTEAVDLFFEAINQDREIDVLITGVPEDITRKIFPKHGRIVGKFRDQSLYPGEMLALKHSIIPLLMDEIDQLSKRRRQFNRRIDNSRLIPVMRYLAKKPRLWVMILRYLAGRISVAETEMTLSRVYQMKIKTLVIPDPGFGMDLDLPEDYQKLSNYLKNTRTKEIKTLLQKCSI